MIVNKSSTIFFIFNENAKQGFLILLFKVRILITNNNNNSLFDHQMVDKYRAKFSLKLFFVSIALL